MAADDAYADWKRYHANNAFRFGRKDAKYYRGQFAGHDFKGARLLELGFGAGQFLAWAREQGAQASGTEVNAPAVEHGRNAGYEVYHGPVEAIEALQEREFDLVVAIDVLEHLDETTLDWVLAHLSADGVCIARVPNAASPFGLPVHAGDLTHRQSLSFDAFRQLSHRHGFEIVSCRNQYRSWAGGFPALRQWLARTARRATEAWLRFILELRDTPLDMNIVVTFRRRRDSARK
jgi:2-polyprenyl-3-methyl-5-hydroxy-6-metoxy-1,4-benzoquinol methylase